MHRLGPLELERNMLLMQLTYRRARIPGHFAEHVMASSAYPL